MTTGLLTFVTTIFVATIIIRYLILIKNEYFAAMLTNLNIRYEDVIFLINVLDVVFAVSLIAIIYAS